MNYSKNNLPVWFNRKNLTYFFLALVFITPIVSYWMVPKIFFQQDEILGFGLFIKEGSRIILRGLAAGNISHFVPVAMFVSYSIYSLFGLNFIVFNLLGLLFHLVNAVLVYLLGKRIFGNKLASLISAVVFVSSSVAAELLMWPVINLNVISLTFSLLAWLVIIDKNILKRIKDFWRMILITILFFLSIFSVEYSAGFALFIPVAYLLLKSGKTKAKVIKLLPFVLTLFAYFLFRFIPVVGNKGLSGVSAAGGIPIYFRWIELIPRYFGQLFLGQPIILFISRVIGKVTGPTSGFELFVERNIFPLVAFCLGVAVITASIFVYRTFKKIGKDYSNMFLLTVLVITFSSLPFLFVPGDASSFSIFSSRYMYFGVVGLAIYIGFVNDYFMKEGKMKESIFALCFTLLLIASGTISNYQKGQSLLRIGQMRLGIIKFIDSSIVNIPQKTIIYTESNKSYYGLPDEEKIFPFQSGLGQTLLLFLNQRGKFPREFFPGNYLWEIKSQGYREFQGRGFGYFRNLDLLKKTVKDYSLPKDSVFAFSWNGITGEITNISDRIRHEIR